MYMISDCTCMSMHAHFVNICVVNIDLEMNWAWNLCTGQKRVTTTSLALKRSVITSAKEDVIVVARLSVYLLATLRKNYRTDLHEIFREGWQWTSEQLG